MTVELKKPAEKNQPLRDCVIVIAVEEGMVGEMWGEEKEEKDIMKVPMFLLFFDNF